MYDDIATLLSIATTGRDKYGNPIVTKTEREVFVQPQGVYSSEFYNAAQMGLKPSITFLLANREDYHDEPIIKYRDVDYNIIRVDWNAQRDSLRLICEKKVNP